MPTVETLMRDWQARRAPVCTDRTNATNRAPVEMICQEFGHLDVKFLSSARVELFRNFLLELGHSKITVARYLSTLRAGLGEHGELLKLGMLIAELKRGPNTVECWTKQEAAEILNAIPVRDTGNPFWYYISFLLATGMRRGELLALHWEDFDLKQKRIHIHRALTLDGSLQNGTKWGGERWFPMGKLHLELHGWIQKRCVCPEYGERGLIFYSLDQRTVGRQFNRVRDAAGVPAHKMHCTRHSAISWALCGGVSLRKASEIFGVSQGTLEKHYAHFIPEEVDMEWAEL